MAELLCVTFGSCSTPSTSSMVAIMLVISVTLMLPLSSTSHILKFNLILQTDRQQFIISRVLFYSVFVCSSICLSLLYKTELPALSVAVTALPHWAKLQRKLVCFNTTLQHTASTLLSRPSFGILDQDCPKVSLTVCLLAGETPYRRTSKV